MKSEENKHCNEIKEKEDCYKGKYKVGMVQSVSRGSLSNVPSVVFTPEVIQQYFGECIPLITTNDPKEIFDFIVKNAIKYKIYRYNLQNNSSTIINVINYIHERKRTSRTVRKLLSKCILCCTYSNADIVRELNVKKNTKLSFCLSRVSTVLSNYDGTPENKTFLIVSGSTNTFYEQVFNIDIKPKCRVNELKANDITDFMKKGGYKLFVSLSTREEYVQVINEINKTSFEGEIVVLELDYPDEMTKLINKNIIVSTVSSGVGMLGEKSQYVNLNEYLPYDTTAVVLCKNYQCWPDLLDSGVIWIDDDKETSKPKQSMVNGGMPRKITKKPKPRGTGTSTQSVPTTTD